ncbi:DUF5685 family protein [Lachnospira sp.]|jgi:hypothetical protein|uniref:DUF5685 family protein n=1 Tax=Lachnospira sp. TaxID=2049031 RepID=UPI00257F04C5|nr:DUF5685 family protein [Lachnospira sp.]
MFGYVIVNKPELKIREFDEYRSYYCGLCHTLRSEYGFKAQMTLSYDLTMAVLLLTALYEPEVTRTRRTCKAHPIKKQAMSESIITNYVADMNVLMSYYHLVDDWKDERKIQSKAYASLLSKNVSSIKKRYPQKAAAIEAGLNELSSYEQANEDSIIKVSQSFGKVLAEVLTYKDDEWKTNLHNLGMALGQFIYIMDAYDDLEKDKKTGNYNVLKGYEKEEDFDIFVENILKAHMTVVAREFEFLPIIENAEILRNIIYSGVFIKFEEVKKRRAERKNEINNDIKNESKNKK